MLVLGAKYERGTCCSLSFVFRDKLFIVGRRGAEAGLLLLHERDDSRTS